MGEFHAGGDDNPPELYAEMRRADALEKRVAELERNAKDNKREAGMMIEALFNDDIKLASERKRADELQAEVEALKNIQRDDWVTHQNLVRAHERLLAKLETVREMCEENVHPDHHYSTGENGRWRAILATLDAPVEVVRLAVVTDTVPALLRASANVVGAYDSWKTKPESVPDHVYLGAFVRAVDEMRSAVNTTGSILATLDAPVEYTMVTVDGTGSVNADRYSKAMRDLDVVEGDTILLTKVSRP